MTAVYYKKTLDAWTPEIELAARAFSLAYLNLLDTAREVGLPFENALRLADATAQFMRAELIRKNAEATP